MVKRYGWTFDAGSAYLDQKKDGMYVKHDDYAALQAECERLKSESGYTAADIATAAADGFRDGVRSVDLEEFRTAIEFWNSNCETPHLMREADRLMALIEAHKEG